MKSDPHDPIESLLNRWEPEPPLPTDSLAPDIWRRIGAAESTQPSGWARVHAIFARKSFAAAFVAACVLLGLFLAETRRLRLQAEFNSTLVQNYLRSMDPLIGAAESNITREK